MNIRKILPLISIILLAALLYFSDLNSVVSVILRANLILILLALAVESSNTFIKVIRWKLFLKNLKISCTLRECAYSYLPALFLSNFTPARIGEPFRAYFLKKIKKTSMSNVIPSIIIERSLDVFTLVLLSLFILLTFNLGYMIYFNIGLVIVIIFIGLTVLKSEKFLTKLLNFGFKIFSFYPKLRKMGEGRGDVVGRFKRGFKIKKTILFVIFLLSILSWSLDGLVFYIAFVSIGIELPLFLVVSIFAFSVLMGVITFLPGGIGSMEFVFVLILSSFIVTSQAMAGVILGRFLTFWFVMFISSLFWRKV